MVEGGCDGAGKKIDIVKVLIAFAGFQVASNLRDLGFATRFGFCGSFQRRISFGPTSCSAWVVARLSDAPKKVR